jgi:hypothetical protein
MKGDKAMGCQRCEFWNDRSARGDAEWFTWMGYQYNIDRAREMTDGREPSLKRTSELADHVSYVYPGTGIDEDYNMFGVSVDEGHADHVVSDGVQHIIMARAPNGSHMPIDGHHRIVRAMKLGQRFCHCVFLDMEETVSIRRKLN